MILDLELVKPNFKQNWLALRPSRRCEPQRQSLIHESFVGKGRELPASLQPLHAEYVRTILSI